MVQRLHKLSPCFTMFICSGDLVVHLLQAGKVGSCALISSNISTGIGSVLNGVVQKVYGVMLLSFEIMVRKIFYPLWQLVGSRILNNRDNIGPSWPSLS